MERINEKKEFGLEGCGTSANLRRMESQFKFIEEEVNVRLESSNSPSERENDEKKGNESNQNDSQEEEKNHHEDWKMIGKYRNNICFQKENL